MNALGRPSAPVDWRARTDGTAQYTGDLDPPGLLTGAVLRSPHPHARIVAIDTRRAAALPGVAAVLTAADLPDRNYLDYGDKYSDRPALARGVVRHIGEPVAIVAAETREQAAAAMRLITVTYRRLRPLPTVADALRRGAPLIHAGTARNIASEVHQSHGDFAAARARAVCVVRGSYTSAKQSHAIMEPHTVLAHWLPDQERLEIWAPSQGPRAVHGDLAHVLGLDEDRVHLNEVAVGGDFGSRVDISHLEALAAFLSIRTSRPVRFTHTRQDEFAYTKSRQTWDVDLEMGADADGTVTHLGAEILSDNGAYNMAGPSETSYGATALGSAYRISGYEAHGRCVYTTKQPPSSFRGAGGFPPNFALEVIADELADAVGMDPIDFRVKNMVSQPGETSVTGWKVKSSRLLECLETVRREIGWDAKRPLGGSGRGVGVAACIHVTGLRREGMVESGAAVDVQADGRIRLRTGVGDPGTGQKTMLVQVVADELGIDPAEVDLVTTDTDRTPHDTGAGASRGTFVSAHAVGMAARAAATALRELAAAKHGGDPAGIRIEAGHAVGNGHHTPIGELVGLAADTVDGELRVEVAYVGDFEDEDGTGHGDLSATYSFAAQAVEVEVDAQTGAVRVLQVVAAHDSGRILNPLTARGQVEGGVVMGLGAALREELIFEDGRAVNTGYADYAMPRAADAPPVKVFFLGADDPVGPYGAKGLGEIALLPTGAATVNAVSHALGIRVRAVPLTPDRIITAVRERDGGRTTRLRPIALRPGRWWVAGIRWTYPRGLHRLLHRYGTRLARPPRTGEIEQLLMPSGAAEAVAALAADSRARPLAGGSDLLVARRQQLVAPAVLVDLTGVAGFTGIRLDEDGLSLGAVVTLSQLCEHRAIPAVLRETARLIASPQIRAVATLAGNLCQEKRCWFYRQGFDCYKRSGPASPCYAVLGDHRFYHAAVDGHRCQAVTPSDLATTLAALDAVVHIRDARGERAIGIADLYSGPGETMLRPEEIITRVAVPAAALARTTEFRKLRLWEGGFAVVSAAVSVSRDASGRIGDCRAVLGGVAPVPLRAHETEHALTGLTPTHDLLARAAGGWTRHAHPLPGNDWKLDAAAGLLRQALASATGLELEDEN
ncbi:molybdopterin-dependent oxidoreductase [Streptomyces atratus]|uniref:molybdopterin cofactor-binding domain-containing protein n=1 Tax=Streptomyces atratus TaxID=1893 RepID=UPI001670CAC2|nr:molybdopterin cofactor-binding domain-containing protein [Streptomyces atratus]WPW26304.1 molybdopterin-dependent oxidoreductase [Streptomyces atratus]GGT65804.1 hypothetical protein GCM10010207_76120 [Streptomyces atratus]